MKKLLVVLGSIMLIAAVAYPVSAWGPRWGGDRHMGYGGHGFSGNYGQGYGRMTEAQHSQMDDLYQKFFDKTAPLKNQTWTKYGEMDILLGTSSPDPDRVRTLQKEISDLEGKLAQERVDMVLEARKIVPKGNYFRGRGAARGRHMGMGGNGPGGPGECWN